MAIKYEIHELINGSKLLRGEESTPRQAEVKVREFQKSSLNPFTITPIPFPFTTTPIHSDNLRAGRSGA